jgi:hypothetical protein
MKVVNREPIFSSKLIVVERNSLWTIQTKHDTFGQCFSTQITPRLVFLLQTTIFSIILKKQFLSTKALQNWKIFVKALSKQ